MKFFVGGGAARTYTDEKVAALLDAAPEALNTLNELAAALNDDANFAATVTSSLASAESAANAYTDAEVSSATSSLQAYADQAEADAVTTAAADATSKADAAQSAAEAYADSGISSATSSLQAYADQAEADAITASRIPSVADPSAVYSGGYDTIGQLVFVESEGALWILAGGSDGTVQNNWSAFVRGATAGVTTTSSLATQSSVDAAVGSLISPLLLAGM